MTEKENEHTAPSRLFGGGAHPAPLHWLFFPAAVLYHELLLRAFDAQSVFFDGALALILLFAVGTGLFWSLIVNLLRRPRAAFIVSVTVTALWSVLVCVEYCCRSYFKSYFFLRFIGNMSENVVTGFGSAIPEVVLPRLPFILLAMLPVVGCVLLRRRIAPPQRMGWKPLLMLLALSLAFGGTGSVLAHGGMYKTSYTYGFNADAGVTHFGLNTTVRLEMTYALFGQPAPDIQVPEDDGGDRAGGIRQERHGHRLRRAGGKRLQLRRGQHVPLLRQPDALLPERVHRYVQGQEPDPVYRRGVLPVVHQRGADARPVPPDPRGLCVQQFLSARLGTVHHRRRVRGDDRPDPHVGQRQRQLLRHRPQQHALCAGQPVPGAGLYHRRLPRQHLQLLQPRQDPPQSGL